MNTLEEKERFDTWSLDLLPHVSIFVSASIFRLSPAPNKKNIAIGVYLICICNPTKIPVCLQKAANVCCLIPPNAKKKPPQVVISQTPAGAMLFFISIIASKKKVSQEHHFFSYPTNDVISLSYATWLFYFDELGDTRLTSPGSLGLSLNLLANSSILGINSPILKGLLTTSSMPAASKVAICSLLAFAVTAMIGT